MHVLRQKVRLRLNAIISNNPVKLLSVQWCMSMKRNRMGLDTWTHWTLLTYTCTSHVKTLVLRRCSRRSYNSPTHVNCVSWLCNVPLAYYRFYPTCFSLEITLWWVTCQMSLLPVLPQKLTGEMKLYICSYHLFLVISIIIMINNLTSSDTSIVDHLMFYMKFRVSWWYQFFLGWQRFIVY